MKNKKYYPSQNLIKKKTSKKEDIILLHRINVSYLSKRLAEEKIYRHSHNCPKSHGRLNILNIVIPMRYNDDVINISSDVNILYRTSYKNDIDSYFIFKEIFKDKKAFDLLSKNQQRKLKTFKLINY